MNIVVVSPLNPIPINEGRRFRIYAILKALSLRHQLTVICQVAEADRASLPELERMVGRVIAVDKRAVRNYERSGSRLSRWVEYFLHPYPWFIRSRISNELMEELARIDWSHIDVLWLVNLPLSGNVLPMLQRARRQGLVTVIDLDDYESAKQWRFVRRLPPGSPAQLKEWIEYWRLRWYERELLPQMTWALVCSDADQHALQRRGFHNTAVIPNTIVLDGYPTTPSPERYDLVFTGMMGYIANVDAMTWFCRTAWPRVLRWRPTTRLWIVGRNPDARVTALAALPNVTVTGAVPNVTEYLTGARVVIAPLRMGGGTRIKILEAMACHRPVITTRVGCEGLAVRDGVEVVLADTPQAQAEACVRLLNDAALRYRMGQAARALVEREYAWTRLPEWLERLWASPAAEPSSAVLS